MDRVSHHIREGYHRVQSKDGNVQHAIVKIKSFSTYAKPFVKPIANISGGQALLLVGGSLGILGIGLIALHFSGFQGSDVLNVVASKGVTAGAMLLFYGGATAIAGVALLAKGALQRKEVSIRHELKQTESEEHSIQADRAKLLARITLGEDIKEDGQIHLGRRIKQINTRREILEQHLAKTEGHTNRLLGWTGKGTVIAGGGLLLLFAGQVGMILTGTGLGGYGGLSLFGTVALAGGTLIYGLALISEGLATSRNKSNRAATRQFDTNREEAILHEQELLEGMTEGTYAHRRQRLEVELASLEVAPSKRHVFKHIKSNLMKTGPWSHLGRIIIAVGLITAVGAIAAAGLHYCGGIDHLSLGGIHLDYNPLKMALVAFYGANAVWAGYSLLRGEKSATMRKEEMILTERLSLAQAELAKLEELNEPGDEKLLQEIRTVRSELAKVKKTSRWSKEKAFGAITIFGGIALAGIFAFQMSGIFKSPMIWREIGLALNSSTLTVAAFGTFAVWIVVNGRYIWANTNKKRVERRRQEMRLQERLLDLSQDRIIAANL